MSIFSNLFGRRQNSVLGLDISSSAVKVVELRKKSGKAILETYGELSLGPYGGLEVGRATNLPVEKIAEAVNDLLREAKTTTRNCGVAIPFSSSLMAMIEVPAVDQRQLEEMIPIEARKYIPVPINEVMLDWWVIPEDEDYVPSEEESSVENKAHVRKLKVLVVALHNDTIAKYKQLMQLTGLNSSFFEIEIFSTLRSIVDQSVNPVMVLDMGAGSTKIYIVERGLIRNTHTINRGSQDITLAISKSMGVPVERAELMKRDMIHGNITDKGMSDIMFLVLDDIFSEANQVLLNYQKLFNKSISKVILTGGGVEIGRFMESAINNFQTEVEIANPFSKVEAPAFLGDILREVGPEFAVTVGVALRKLQELP